MTTHIDNFDAYTCSTECMFNGTWEKSSRKKRFPEKWSPVQKPEKAFSVKGVVRLIRAKKSIFSIIFFKDTINIYLFV